ncbi:MAG: hypothetical protein BEN19_02555 [Epulopiscium sp. Nuni2H_MBin003]|nr:MAG: hypothetical protein BEN19_02555 [Epulopiscium sp. Nuni2H_MBin003]
MNVTDVLVLAGELLLGNGAEVFRVQDTINRIANAYNVADFEIYVLSNGMFMSICEDGQHYKASVKNVPITAAHLGRVAQICNLSRSIVAGECTTREAYCELLRIRDMPGKSNVARILYVAIGSGSFCYLIGGTINDIMTTVVSVSILHRYLIYMENHQASKMMLNMIGASIATFFGLLLVNLGLGDDIDNIISASIISLVPGIALTNSIRDLFNGDYLSGTIRLIDALLVAFSIAAGVGGMIAMWQNLFGGFFI